MPRAAFGSSLPKLVHSYLERAQALVSPDQPAWPWEAMAKSRPQSPHLAGVGIVLSIKSVDWTMEIQQEVLASQETAHSSYPCLPPPTPSPADLIPAALREGPLTLLQPPPGAVAHSQACKQPHEQRPGGLQEPYTSSPPPP